MSRENKYEIDMCNGSIMDKVNIICIAVDVIRYACS